MDAFIDFFRFIVPKMVRNFLPRLGVLPFHSKAVGGALVMRSSVMAHEHGGYPCLQFDSRLAGIGLINFLIELYFDVF